MAPRRVRAGGDLGGRRRARPGFVLACVLLLAAVTAPAAHAEDAVPRSVHFADLLRRDPVYVTDQLPRELPRSTKPRFAALARRTGVPTYVLVLPDRVGTGSSLLGPVHDRLGRNGLYVLVSERGVVDARAFGVDAPAQDATTVALYSLPYDAGALRAFRTFADTVAEGGTEAARRADMWRERYGGTGKEAPPAYLTSTDRENQSFLTGAALTGLPLSVLLVSAYVRRRRRSGAGARAARGASAGWPVVAEVAVAAALALGVGYGAPHVFDQRVDSAAPAPVHSDLTARLDRISAGLRHDPIYADPESPAVLDARRTAELERRVRDFAPGPVFLVLVPQLSDDESGGDRDAFLTSLHHRLGRDGVYVLADPLEGSVTVSDYGLRIDASRLTLDLPASLSEGGAAAQAESDHALGSRLEGVMALLEKAPRTDSPGGSGPAVKAEPIPDHRLPALFTTDFRPGLAMGALGAGLLLALVAAALGTARLVAGRRAKAPSGRGPAPEAPSAPSTGRLRHLVREELDALATEFARDEPAAAERTRVWDCLDAALLLTDRDEDGRVAAGVGPADLVAALVLARAGRAALKGRPVRHVCAFNPLHGPATGRPEARSGASRAAVRLCRACRTACRRDPRRADDLRLTLPGKGARVPYDEAPGVLPSVRDGVSALVSTVREDAGVR